MLEKVTFIFKGERSCDKLNLLINRFNYHYLPEMYIIFEGCRFRLRKDSIDLFQFKPNKEREVLNVMKTIREGTFIDVGSHVGKYTCVVAKQLEGKGKVISIEADPNNFKALQENIKLNKLKNVEAYNVAAFSENKRIKFYSGSLTEASQSSAIIKPKNSNIIEVNATRLDSIVKKKKDITLMKIDVEGAEFEVLKGSREILRKAKPILIVENMYNKIFQKCKEMLVDEFIYLCQNLDGLNYMFRPTDFYEGE